MPDLPGYDSGVPDRGRAEVRLTLNAVPVLTRSARDGAPFFAAVLTPPAGASRARAEERLLFLFNPLGEGAPLPRRDPGNLVRDTYWGTPGSVTAALRRAMAVANRHLLDYNLKADRSDRCYAGIALAVLSDGDLFLLQAGPAWSCILQEQQFTCFPRGEKLSPLGIGPVADVRLRHTLVAPGDTLLLAPHILLRATDQEKLCRALSRTSVSQVADALRGLSDDEFAAVVARCSIAPEADLPSTKRRPRARRFEGSSPAVGQGGQQARPSEGTGRQTRLTGPQGPERTLAHEEERVSPPVGRWFHTTFIRAFGALMTGLRAAGRYFAKCLTWVWHSLAAGGAGMLALGRWLMGAVGVTIRSMLPGTHPATTQRVRRPPPPKENRRVMTGVAIAIPVVIIVAVVLAYRQFAAASRFEGLVNQAQEQIALAQAAETDSEEARLHWEAALQQIETAATLQPEDSVAQDLRDQAREALDGLNRIKRLTLIRLASFGSSSSERRLLPAGDTLFVLDSAEGWVSAVPLRGGAETDQIEEGDDAQEARPVIVRTGQQVEGHEIGDLVDSTWVGTQGGRRSSALLVLEDRHRLVSYDPAWRTESGAPQLSLLELPSPAPSKPVAIGSYQGQFYIMDVAAEGGGQIWRYKPDGEAYPHAPEPYFQGSSPENLTQAVDMAIDGCIYILYQDGTVRKFLGGETQPFDVQGIPGHMGDVGGFALDPEGDGTVYLADGANDRIVVLDPEGRFRWQYRADLPLTDVEALAVRQAESRLYIIVEGEVYLATLP